jgi:hypothetical protein
VKTDLSCCLCDLGFAMKISGSKYFHNGEEQHAETKSINDVSDYFHFIQNKLVVFNGYQGIQYKNPYSSRVKKV